MTLLFNSCKGEHQKEKIESEDAVTKNVKTYEELIDRVEQIGCTDRIPKITLEDDEEIRKIYFLHGCNENGDKELIKARNVIRIYDDKVSDYFDEEFYPLDSLKNILDKNIKNYGKDWSLSSSPDKLIFSIVYDLDANPRRLKNTLLQLTKAFDEIGGRNVLRIILDKEMQIAPPPPPAPEVIEVVEDEVLIEKIVEVFDDDGGIEDL
jgi:hypothetical protein